ncbi:hypothetical protein CRG98_015452 [Punica granatum]|uniref:Uncharacterized protein n=1 Tax=Punica granatum TaxID=22663 RepID=A0A2I0K6L2_PUNGR|nr:hypothetical protein CRG98_015452 [Punica granatum]
MDEGALWSLGYNSGRRGLSYPDYGNLDWGSRNQRWGSPCRPPHPLIDVAIGNKTPGNVDRGDEVAGGGSPPSISGIPVGCEGAPPATSLPNRRYRRAHNLPVTSI